MLKLQNYRWIRGFVRTTAVALFVLLLSPVNATAYGGYGYHHGYGYSHHSVHGHYSHHGHIGTTGYVILGLLGIAVLSHIFNNDRRDYRPSRAPRADYLPRVERRASRPAAYPRTTARRNNKPLHSYTSNEGWDSLTKGNVQQALKIFAVQSQQNLTSGTAKIGFAIAAAANGEMDRGVWAMRKAIKIDPDSLNKVVVNGELETMIDSLNEEYKSTLDNKEDQPYHSLMIAALSYMQKDYATANDIIAESDHSQSANNLRELINRTK